MSKKPVEKHSEKPAEKADDGDHELLMAVARATQHISPEVKAMLRERDGK